MLDRRTNLFEGAADPVEGAQPAPAGLFPPIAAEAPDAVADLPTPADDELTVPAADEPLTPAAAVDLSADAAPPRPAPSERRSRRRRRRQAADPSPVAVGPHDETPAQPPGRSCRRVAAVLAIAAGTLLVGAVAALGVSLVDLTSDRPPRVREAQATSRANAPSHALPVTSVEQAARRASSPAALAVAALRAERRQAARERQQARQAAKAAQRRRAARRAQARKRDRINAARAQVAPAPPTRTVVPTPARPTPRQLPASPAPASSPSTPSSSSASAEFGIEH